ncbi:hypothetical protein Hanom_Chr16g01512451 [Helianthus anomalus]
MVSFGFGFTESNRGVLVAPRFSFRYVIQVLGSWFEVCFRFGSWFELLNSDYGFGSLGLWVSRFKFWFGPYFSLSYRSVRFRKRVSSASSVQSRSDSGYFGLVNRSQTWSKGRVSGSVKPGQVSGQHKSTGSGQAATVKLSYGFSRLGQTESTRSNLVSSASQLGQPS